jgi:hypothetical protein
VSGPATASSRPASAAIVVVVQTVGANLNTTFTTVSNTPKWHARPRPACSFARLAGASRSGSGATCSRGAQASRCASR